MSKIEKLIQRGGYGEVYEFTNDNKKLALKKNLIEKDISFSGVLRETDILTQLKGHPHIVELKQIFHKNPDQTQITLPVDNFYKNDHIHFAFEKANYDLFHGIYMKELDDKFFKRMIVHMILGMDFIHSKGYIHCDVKPSNMLIFLDENKNPTLKICDFGMAFPYQSKIPKTDKSSTYLYRAPEISLLNPYYTQVSDMWGIGCIMYEMCIRNTFLVECSDTQISIVKNIILKLPNLPNEELLETLTDTKISEEASTYMKNNYHQMSQSNIVEFKEIIKSRNAITWSSLLKLDDETKTSGISDKGGFIDLISHLMDFNPATRYTAAKALEHPYLSEFRDYIQITRNKYIPQATIGIQINLCDITARDAIYSVVMCIYNKRQNLNWYSNIVLFQSINLYYRSIYHFVNEQKHTLDYHTSRFHYLGCLYIAIKYFYTEEVLSFLEMIRNINYHNLKEMINESTHSFANDFEGYLIKNVLNYHIYQKTCYEVSLDKITNSGVYTEKLLNYYLKLPQYTIIDSTTIWKNFITIHG
jgi:serine/threonine protein kinase